VLLLLTGESPDIAQRLSAACKRLEWEKRLTVFFRPLEAEPIPYQTSHHARRYALQAIGADKAGIVAKLSRCLADQHINISQMQTQSRREPESGTPIYTVQMAMDVPREVDEQQLRERLDQVAGELCVEVVLEPRQS
jgi:glycine cleavage system transcriptional repressor